jgi:HD-like signal output (HDOD) protein
MDDSNSIDGSGSTGGAAVTKSRVLFVDDDPHVLGVLRYTFGRSNAEWEVELAPSGTAALELMAAQPFDIVVTDLRMPKMSGVQLLNEVMQKYPRTIRIMISGYAEPDLVLGSLGTAHQFVAKPFELSSVRNTLIRLRNLNRLLESDEVRPLLNGLQKLPSIPAIYLELIDALSSMDSPLERVCSIVETDPALTAKLLQLVNSAFFGVSREVSRVSEAVQLLGLGLVRSLALGIHLFKAFDQSRFQSFSIDAVWNHSLQVALLARRILQSEGCPQHAQEQAFTGGLLHDAGKMILAENHPARYHQIIERSRSRHQPLHQAEQEILGADHALIGAYLFVLWGLPVSLTECVAWHHQPSRGVMPELSPLTAVHVANAVVAGREAEGGGKDRWLDWTYLDTLGMRTRLPAWSQLNAG